MFSREDYKCAGRMVHIDAIVNETLAGSAFMTHATGAEREQIWDM